MIGCARFCLRNLDLRPEIGIVRSSGRNRAKIANRTVK